MIKLLRHILQTSMFCMYCICAIAAPDAEMPIAINSDQANFDHKHGIATYTGRVTVKQGTRDLHANKLVIQRDESNKIKVMIATGNPAVFSSQANTAKPGSGKANIIKYYPQANKVDLFENASLTQNGDTVTGPQLTYNFVTEELQSKHTQKERTTVILQPKRVP